MCIVSIDIFWERLTIFIGRGLYHNSAVMIVLSMVVLLTILSAFTPDFYFVRELAVQMSLFVVNT